MILSTQSLLSENQAVTATALSTNVIDLGVAGTPFGAAAPLSQDIGKGAKVPVLVQVTTAFAGLTSIAVSIETSAVAAMTGSKVLASQTILLADLVAGKQVNFDVLPNGVDQQFLAVRYTVVGTGTAGTITAGITMGNQTNI